MCIYACISCKCMCMYKYAMKVSTVLTSVISVALGRDDCFSLVWPGGRLGWSCTPEPSWIPANLADTTLALGNHRALPEAITPQNHQRQDSSPFATPGLNWEDPSRRISWERAAFNSTMNWPPPKRRNENFCSVLCIVVCISCLTGGGAPQRWG